ncbi:MAG: alpha-galactosidase, partial [Candidatus Ornithospirochaeta sp.]|nr:alpha-galactosidase [Candidatus Ornithospirochaeta sp.]
ELSKAELILTYIVKGSSLVRGMRIAAKDRAITIRKALYSMDYLFGDKDVTYFEGRHCSERTRRRASVGTGALTFTSRRGATSHQISNGFILSDSSANEDGGNAVLMELLWSGSFTFFAEKNQYGSTRAALGMGSEYFEYCLRDSYLDCPELLLTFSDKGFGDLSVRNSRFIMDHIRHNPASKLNAPVLLNNWEATYFGFTGEKLIEIARSAKALGCDLFVLDDGWFGHRNDDLSSLGDWYENTEKLGMDLGSLSERIRKEGIAFGLWVEPEMVSEESDLYRKHPDWALRLEGRKPSRGRYQLVLDLTRKDVRDFILSFLTDLIERGKLSYMKWDYNRFITDFFSSETPRGQIEYDYIIGLYSIFESLNSRFPSLMIEGCSGGGGRFDLGMLYCTPQSWLSDDTDAIERLDIEIGSSYLFPIASFGSHISAVPNHQTGRSTPLFTRSTVAMLGSFGLELDPDSLSDAEKDEIRAEIVEYRKLSSLIRNGDFYRLNDTAEYSAAMVVSENKEEALLIAVNRLSHGNPLDRYARLTGLDEKKIYRVNGMTMPGSLLVNAGLLIPFSFTVDYEAVRLHIKEAK